MDQLEQDIYDLWAELQPDTAFSFGDNSRAGKFFIPTFENIDDIMSKINQLKVETLDSVNLGILNCFKTTLEFEEPYMPFYKGVWSFFYYLVKEGVNVDHITKLTKNMIEALRTISERMNSKKWSVEIKVVTMTNYLGLLGILDTMEKKSPNLKPVFDEFKAEMKKFMKKFTVNGIKVGDFSEVFPILEKKGGNIGRKEVYPNILRDMYGYLETSEEIETQALLWLNEEQPGLMKITEKLAKIHQVEPTIEAVSAKLAKQGTIERTKLLGFIEKLRRPLRKVVENKIVRITPKYDTRILETPEYLLNFISTGAMTPFDILKDDPFNIFFVTTDPKRSPPTNTSELIQLIIHEEFGHCVHFSNSATKFDAKLSVVELLKTTLALSISDGISFYREWESLMLLKDIMGKSEQDITVPERELLNILHSVNDLHLLLLETEFTIMRWRIIRFLRAIGDVRINMHKQSIAEFVTWAHEYTGLSKKAIFDQIFLFMARPGYAPCYSIVGERIRELQERAKSHGQQAIDFNTYASSLGFPPRNVFEQKLREY